MEMKQTQSTTNNKYVIVPCFSQATKAVTVEKKFTFDNIMNFKKDEEYFITEINETEFGLFNSGGDFIGKGTYTESTETEDDWGTGGSGGR